MSASGYKQTSRELSQNVRFTPESGHSDRQERFGLKKRALNVCFTPNSGHWHVARRCVRSGRESSGTRLARHHESYLRHRFFLLS